MASKESGLSSYLEAASMAVTANILDKGAYVMEDDPCGWGSSTGIFYHGDSLHDSRRAKTLCKTACTKQLLCTIVSLATDPAEDDWGVWGGLSREERDNMREVTPENLLKIIEITLNWNRSSDLDIVQRLELLIRYVKGESIDSIYRSLLSSGEAPNITQGKIKRDIQRYESLDNYTKQRILSLYRAYKRLASV